VPSISTNRALAPISASGFKFTIRIKALSHPDKDKARNTVPERSARKYFMKIEQDPLSPSLLCGCLVSWVEQAGSLLVKDVVHLG
jgi:hypothetical protein